MQLTKEGGMIFNLTGTRLASFADIIYINVSIILNEVQDIDRLPLRIDILFQNLKSSLKLMISEYQKQLDLLEQKIKLRQSKIMGALGQVKTILSTEQPRALVLNVISRLREKEQQICEFEDKFIKKFGQLQRSKACSFTLQIVRQTLKICKLFQETLLYNLPTQIQNIIPFVKCRQTISNLHFYIDCQEFQEFHQNVVRFSRMKLIAVLQAFQNIVDPPFKGPIGTTLSEVIQRRQQQKIKRRQQQRRQKKNRLSKKLSLLYEPVSDLDKSQLRNLYQNRNFQKEESLLSELNYRNSYISSVIAKFYRKLPYFLRKVQKSLAEYRIKNLNFNYKSNMSLKEEPKRLIYRDISKKSKEKRKEYFNSVHEHACQINVSNNSTPKIIIKKSILQMYGKVTKSFLSTNFKHFKSDSHFKQGCQKKQKLFNYQLNGTRIVLNQF